MTSYEYMRWLTMPIMPVIISSSRKKILKLVKMSAVKQKRMSILDVGGRKSPYTTGVKADITLLDIPQESQTQEDLNLGFTYSMLNFIKHKRSNIKNIIIQDMTQSTLEDESYDAVISVEVIEHVEKDDLFIKNISNVIKKGGWAYFTTPNGDYIKNVPPNNNPDHKRHYTRQELQNLLENYFDEVAVSYAVSTGKYRVWGLKKFTLRKPVQLMRSIFGNIINGFQSKNVGNRATRTAHLIAVAYKD